MATIKVMSGGAPKEVFGELTPQFERQSPAIRSTSSFAVMTALRERLAGRREGRRAGHADQYSRRLSAERGRARANIARVLGLVSVNAVVRTGAPMPDLSTSDAVKQADAQQPRQSCSRRPARRRAARIWAS